MTLSKARLFPRSLVLKLLPVQPLPKVSPKKWSKQVPNSTVAEVLPAATASYDKLKFFIDYLNYFMVYGLSFILMILTSSYHRNSRKVYLTIWLLFMFKSLLQIPDTPKFSWVLNNNVLEQFVFEINGFINGTEWKQSIVTIL